MIDSDEEDAPKPRAPLGQIFEPNPAPKLSRTPGLTPRPNPKPGLDTQQVLEEFGFDAKEVAGLLESGAAVQRTAASL